eukprot:m.1042141 g.1042141  ORF g.1042141 m.1042141 type:complete len:239 (+) comp24162_c1_seq19:506-1222(+)
MLQRLFGGSLLRTRILSNGCSDSGLWSQHVVFLAGIQYSPGHATQAILAAMTYSKRPQESSRLVPCMTSKGHAVASEGVSWIGGARRSQVVGAQIMARHRALVATRRGGVYERILRFQGCSVSARQETQGAESSTAAQQRSTCVERLGCTACQVRGAVTEFLSNFKMRFDSTHIPISSTCIPIISKCVLIRHTFRCIQYAFRVMQHEFHHSDFRNVYSDVLYMHASVVPDRSLSLQLA